jgi:hypothetical protein
MWVCLRPWDIFAEVKTLTRGFSRRACGGRTTSWRSDDAFLLAEQVEGLDGLGEADNTAQRKRKMLRTSLAAPESRLELIWPAVFS